MSPNRSNSFFARPAMVAVALAVAAAACGGGNDDDPVVTDETVPSSTTTSDVDRTTTSLEPGEVPTNPLTGLEATDFDVASRPAIVVKLGNNGPGDVSQPHVGINLADIVFEEEIESQSTRFAAVFQSQLPVETGPVRSARVTEVDLVANLTRPMLVDSGANQVTNGIMSQAQRDGLLYRISHNNTSHYRVDGRGGAPNNLFVGFEPLLTLFPDDVAAPTPIFTYGDSFDGTDLAGVGADKFFQIDWIYDDDTELYHRFQDGAPHRVDDGESQLSTTNLVLLFVEYGRSPVPGTPQAITIGEGEVWVLRGGQVQIGTWTREGQPDPYTFEAADGSPIELAPGRTWVMLARPGEVVPLEDDNVDTLADLLLVD